MPSPKRSPSVLHCLPSKGFAFCQGPQTSFARKLPAPATCRAQSILGVAEMLFFGPRSCFLELVSLVGSKSNVRHHGPPKTEPVRPSLPWCFSPPKGCFLPKSHVNFPRKMSAPAACRCFVPPSDCFLPRSHKEVSRTSSMLNPKSCRRAGDVVFQVGELIFGARFLSVQAPQTAQNGARPSFTDMGHVVLALRRVAFPKVSKQVSQVAASTSSMPNPKRAENLLAAWLFVLRQ